MSRSSFSKAYEEIANIEPMEMTFTIEDADLDKLHDILKDINVRECPLLEVQDKHGNEAKYYREPHWIPCSERMPDTNGVYNVTRKISDGFVCRNISDTCYYDGSNTWHDDTRVNHERRYITDVIAWMPMPEPYGGEQE